MTVSPSSSDPGNPPGPRAIPPRPAPPSHPFGTIRGMWDDIVAWFQSPGGARVLQTAIIPALAILVAGLLAAMIARSAVKGVIRRADRVEAASAVASLLEAARASADPDADRGARRRAARLRTEADVRTRLLPLPGAGAAADWAAGRARTLQQRATDGPVSAELDELRDRLVAWVARPTRAKRIFADPSEQSGRAGRGKRSTASVVAAPAESGTPDRDPAPAPVRAPAPSAAASPPAAVFARPVVAATPERSTPEPLSAEAAAVADAEQAAAAALPAWQRTRAGERLQQERSRVRGVEAPTADEAAPAFTRSAPVQLQHPRRGAAVPAADVDDAARIEAARVEAHQQARHARPSGQEAPATGAVPLSQATPTPAWLDTYDDEAQVTQNLDLNAPPPVAASSVRGRGTPGDDLVPRS